MDIVSEFVASQTRRGLVYVSLHTHQAGAHCVRRRLRSVRSSDLGKDIPDVGHDGIWADKEALADFAVRKALSNQAQDLTFAGGKVIGQASGWIDSRLE